MSLGQSQQYFGQQQQVHAVASGTVDRQYLSTLPPAERAASYQRSLVQPTAIYIMPDGTFSKLQAPLISSVLLTLPQSQSDTLAFEAARIFYSQNEFAVAISTIPSFIPWSVSNSFKPSDMITRLTVLCGPPTNPGGGNAELRPLLSMPNLRILRLIFQDYQFKGIGPARWLRPSIGVIMEFKTRRGLNMRLQLQSISIGPDGKPEDIDVEDVELKDITSYLQPPTVEEERAVAESRRIYIAGLNRAIFIF
jgi:hypothetical protein